MNIYEEGGNGGYLNMGAIACNICFEYIPGKLDIEFKKEHDQICDKCQDKIDIDDKYHNETHNLGLFKPTRMKLDYYCINK